ncbi:pyruvate dehydrogenase E2 component (dihydrolipoamide acetyltransferase) [Paenibacillus sp. 1_12]|uniref:2-oxo acid dehydrogenase subunit E2 n=1 Tax=Paenibacillus sp. 1_12 TaxID=1566278 RepID=UPI0008E53B39|nr:2-oxo acid dehydrogenase subunit E2 [Paenibacillus sp. 1_12]SFL58118.1 pyruvate dehydrogenase E2 component (dihydrolipoamide acetyltransferase) [Paenibacillus sp. 1_12]
MKQPDSPLKLREETQLRGIRKLISSRLSTVWHEAVHVTLHKQMDVTIFYAKRQQFSHGFVDYFYYALIQTLKQDEYKKFNAYYDGTLLQSFDSIHLGLAVDHPKGLLVPVIHGTDAVSLDDFSIKRKDLMMRTKLWKQTPQEMEYGTFTISNLGLLGIDFFTPILNPPQVAILGLGRVQFQAISWGWGDVPSNKVTISTSLTIDHRVLDGADAARFLNSLEENFTKLLSVRTEE